MDSKKVIVLIFAATLIAGVQSGQCPAEWREFVGSCYKLIHLELSSEEQRQHCALEDSHLLSIQTLEELKFIEDLSYEYYGDASGILYWTAGFRYNGTHYIWNDGIGSPVDLDLMFLEKSSLSHFWKHVNDVIAVLINPLLKNSMPMSYSALGIRAICEFEIQLPEKNVRVIDGPNENEGVAQMYINGTWGYICDTPGFHEGGWPAVFCKNLNGNESVALEAKFARRVTGVSINESIPLAFQVPDCRPRNTVGMVNCGTNRRTGDTECPRGYKQVVWVNCRPVQNVIE